MTEKLPFACFINPGFTSVKTNNMDLFIEGGHFSGTCNYLENSLTIILLLLLLFFVIYLFIFYFTILYWFCHTSTWIHHGCTRVPNPEHPLPPPSTYHLSGSSQCTRPKHPVSCIEPGLAIHFTYDIIHVSMPFSQIIPPLPSPTESKRLFYTSVSLLLSRIQGYHYLLSKFHIYIH